MKPEEYNEVMKQLDEKINFRYTPPTLPTKYLSNEDIRSAAQINTPENALMNSVENIDKMSSEILNSIQTEIDNRKKGDKENFRYTKRWNRINLAISIISILIAVVSVIIAILF